VVAVLVTVLILAVAYLLLSGVHVLAQAFAGMLFGLFLSTLAAWLRQRTGLPYGWALAVVVLALIGLGAGVGWFLASQLTAQFAELTRQLPQSLERIRDELAQYPWGRYLIEKAPGPQTSLAEVGQFVRATGFISGVAGFLVSTVVILFVGFFGAAEPNQYRQGLFHLFPPRHRPRVEETLDTVLYNLRWWILGQVVLMAAIWATTTVGLWLVGLPLALVLGLIAGILELIPYLGPWLSAVPAVLIALLLSPWHLMLTIALYLGLHVLEGYVLLPLVQRRVVLMPPVLTLLAQVLLGELLGVAGLFIAAPLTVTAVVLLKMLYVEDTLGDQTVKVPGSPEADREAAARRG
jgi:predicted PurR-regulated permease PerM